MKRFLLDALKNDDLQLFKKSSDEKEQGSIESRFKMYRSFFQGVDDPIIVRRYDIGALHYFVLDVGKEEFPIVPVLIIRKNNNFFQAFNNIGHPVCQNISALSRNIKKSSEKFTPNLGPDVNKVISLLPLFGETEKNPVYLSFKGHKVSYPIFPLDAKKTKYPHNLKQILSTFADSYSALKEATIEQTEKYLDFFGKESRKKLQNYFVRIDEETFIAFKELEIRPRVVSYVLDSENLYILVYQGAGGKYRGDSLMYDMVFKGGNGDIKRVNYSIEGSFDSLLKWSEFGKKFIDTVINADVDNTSDL